MPFSIEATLPPPGSATWSNYYGERTRTVNLTPLRTKELLDSQQLLRSSERSARTNGWRHGWPIVGTGYPNAIRFLVSASLNSGHRIFAARSGAVV